MPHSATVRRLYISCQIKSELRQNKIILITAPLVRIHPVTDWKTYSNNKIQIKAAVLYAVTKQLPGDVIFYTCTFESVATPWVLISCIPQRSNIENQYGS